VRIPIVTCVVVALLTVSASAGQSGRESVPTPGIPDTGFAALDQSRASRIAMFSDDFGQLGRYRGDNAALRGRASRIRVIFWSVLPVHNHTDRARDFFAQRSPEKILALNTWLRIYCDTGARLYVDYFSQMVDGSGLLQKDLAADGLYPSGAGHAIMAPLAQAAIDKALK